MMKLGWANREREGTGGDSGSGGGGGGRKGACASV